MNKLNFGLIAEYLVIFIYKIKFYQILHHRMRNFCGEIDLVALRGRQLVFIEVKARSSYLDDRILSTKQQNRIRKSSELFLSHNQKYKTYEVRFDLVVIRPYRLPTIIENAW